MWIATNKGFLSIVEDQGRPGTRRRGDNMLVRARNRKHLEDILRGYAGIDVTIVETPDSDYRFRVSMPRSYVKDMIADMIDDIVYPNFKDSVPEPALGDLYHKWWHEAYIYQRKTNQD